MTSMSTETSPQTRLWLIYMLQDPRDGEARYIGKTMVHRGARQNYTLMAQWRLRTHVRDTLSGKDLTHNGHWKRSLLAAGLEPTLTVVETGVGSGSEEAEKRWITVGRQLGLRLTNSTEGGEGAPGRVVSTETRIKMSRSGKGRKMPPRSDEHRARISAALRGKTGRVHSEVTRAKMSASGKGVQHSPEHNAKVGAALRGRVLSAETRAKISAARRAMGATPKK